MEKRNKDFEKIKQNPKNVRFQKLVSVLKRKGFKVRPGKGGSEHTVSYEDITFIIVKPKSRVKFVKREYVDRAIENIEEVEEVKKKK